MLYHKLLSLNDACRQSLAQAMYGRLVFESEDSDSYQLLEDFIVNTELPQSIKLSILSSFILALDRGHACMSDKDCQAATCKTRFLGETNHTSECQFFKTESSMHERRFRAMALTRQCVQVVMATWNKSIFSPAVLVENSFPVGLSLRMRQWLVTYAVDGFLMCHNICQSSFPTSKAEPDDASSFWQKAELYHLSASVKNIRNEKCATKQQVPTFPFVLDLKA
uniref:Uncharacterized protein n=1 Tax=Ciona savignyi TaxID=51511 RepID=H2Z6X7_CIOSA